MSKHIHHINLRLVSYLFIGYSLVVFSFGIVLAYFCSNLLEI